MRAGARKLRAHMQIEGLTTSLNNAVTVCCILLSLALPGRTDFSGFSPLIAQLFSPRTDGLTDWRTGGLVVLRLKLTPHPIPAPGLSSWRQCHVRWKLVVVWVRQLFTATTLLRLLWASEALLKVMMPQLL